MTGLQVFQKEYGERWAKSVNDGTLHAGMAVVNSETIEWIIGLTDEQVRVDSAVILGDLRGRLRYEKSLLELHQKQELVFQDIGRETYPDPVEEAAEQQETKKRKKKN